MEKNNTNQIQSDTAHKLSLIRLATKFHKDKKQKIDKKDEKWKKSHVKKDPLKIYDMNGQLLFYEFDVGLESNKIGRIKASANKVLGPAVWTIEMGERRWNPEKAMEIASEMFQKKYESKPKDIKLVCYCYPKIGVLASGKEKQRETILIDVASFAPITQEITEEQKIGSAVYSVFDSIPEKDKLDRIKKWEREHQFGQEHFADLDPTRSVLEAMEYAEVFQVFWGGTKRLGLTLNGQEHCVWCAPATGQMLLRYFNYYYEQPDIVTAMNTGWDPNHCYGGSYLSDIVNGIEELTRNYIDSSSDGSPTWAEARDEIDDGNPLGSVVPGHIRACDGYSWSRYPYYSHHYYISVIRHYLYILDPWPVGPNNTFCNPDGGSEYWEDWDTTTHWYHVYCRPCEGTMTCND